MLDGHPRGPSCPNSCTCAGFCRFKSRSAASRKASGAASAKKRQLRRQRSPADPSLTVQKLLDDLRDPAANAGRIAQPVWPRSEEGERLC